MRNHHTKQIASKIRGSFIHLAAVVFACRALIPIGYMPAPLDEGGPVILCHGGTAGAFFRSLAETQSTNVHGHMADPSADPAAGMSNEHPHADEGSDAAHEAWENCPVGTAFSAAPISQEFALSLPEFGHDFGQTEPDAIIRIALSSPYRARAPPAFSRHSI